MGIREDPSLWAGKKGRTLTTALFTGHRPFGVVLTVTEVRHGVVRARTIALQPNSVCVPRQSAALTACSA